ncbi:MAG: EamA family transporter [Actinomycetota bacterium]
MREGPGTAITAAPGPSAVRTWGPLVTLWIVWGTTFLGTSAMVQTMPPLLAAGARYLVGGLLLAAVLVILRGPRVLAITRRQIGTTAFAGIGIIGIWAALVALALQHVPGGVAALIGATVPLWMILLRMASGDRVGWRTSLGVAIGIIGVAAMLLPGGIAPLGDETPGVVALWSGAMVVASMTYAFFSWRSRTLDLPSNTLVTTVYQLLWGGLAVMVAGLVAGEAPVPTGYSGVSWAGFWWLVVASVIGYACYTYLLQHVPLSLVSTFAFVNPIVAVLLGWLLLAEPFSRSVVIGLLVVVTGTALVVLGEARGHRQVATPEP